MNTKQKSDFIKALVGLIVVGVIVVVLYFQFSKESVENISEPAPVLISLPENWKITKQDEDNIVYKIESEPEQGFVSTVVVIESGVPEDQDLKEYINSLKSGARSTIPSLVYTSDKQIEDPYKRELEGYYYNEGTKINVNQELLIKDSSLFTATGSFVNQNDSDKIKQIISRVFEKI